MNAQKILALYQDLINVSEQMLAAVTSQEWDYFVSLSQIMDQKLAVLQTNDIDVSMNKEQIQQKRALIQTFITHDSEIKRNVESRMAVLATIVNGTGTQDRIGALYGTSRLEQ